MHASIRRRYQWLALIVVGLALFLSTFAAPHANAQTVTTKWINWNLKINFPGTMPHAILTIYRGQGINPAQVTDQIQYDISSDCKTFGGLTISGGAATFASNGYIRCKVPTTLTITNDQCAAQMSPFYWFATKVAIGASSASNPIFELVNAGNSPTAQFSLPKSGNTAQTRLTVPNASYLSSSWNISTTNNRVIMGANGPSIITVANYFTSSGWLGFLTAPNWQNYMNTVSDTKIGNWAEPQMIGWQSNRTAEQWPDTSYVYIGHSPSSGTYFTGKMWDGEVDPGCTAK